MYKKVIIMCGLPGSGKSFLAKELQQEFFRSTSDKVAIVSADNYWLRPDGLYDWNAKYIGRAHAWCQEKFKWFLQDEYDLVIVDNTNLSAQERKPYILLAEQYGYSHEVKEPETEWRYNALECSKRNTHGVPLATLDRMLAKLMQDKNGTASVSS